MSSSRWLCLAVVLFGCKYEFVEGPNEAADEDEDSSSDSSEGESGGTDSGEEDQDQPETAGETGETDSPMLCGNGIVDPPEECDEQDFNGRDCMTMGFESGTLACTDQCKLDTSMCR